MPPPDEPGQEPVLTDSDPGTSGEPSFHITTVKDSYAYTGVHLLDLPLSRTKPAVVLHRDACLPLGSRPIGVYPPGTAVLVFSHPEAPWHIILGAVPEGLHNPKLILPDSLVLRGGDCGVLSPMHYAMVSDPKSDLGNYSGGGVVDGLPGAWGHINDLGLAFWINRIQACMRASDGAKVEAFWGEDLLRLVGYNLEIFTAGKQDQQINDEGEYNEIIRRTPFPWEGMGMGSPGDSTTAKQGKLKIGSEDGYYEPKERDQLIIPRQIVLRGYLGDMEHEYICVPPTGLSPETYSKKSNYKGVFEMVKHIDGAFAIRSAKEITFEKVCVIPVPKELIAPEDPSGDGRTNYKAADQVGQGEQYEMPEFQWGEEDAGIRSAQLLDYHAYLFTKYNVEGLAAHKKDWFFPEETEAEMPAGQGKAIYDASKLRIQYKFAADLPDFGTLLVDSRPGHTVKYYRTRSLIKQFDDGSIVLEDGWGSQISMKGGNIYLSCVGDVWAQPGRNFIAWAPHDAILRAGNSADISASLKDVRIKADRNLHMLAGNSDENIGGILLESRAKGPSTTTDFSSTGERVNGHGITFKALKSTIHMFGKDVYIGRNQTEQGVLAIDGGENGTLYMRGKKVENDVIDLFSVISKPLSGPNQSMLALNTNGCVISVPMQIGGAVAIVDAKATGKGAGANLIVSGALIVNKTSVFRGTLATMGSFAANGGIASATGQLFVGPLKTPINVEDPTPPIANLIREQVNTVQQETQNNRELITEDPTVAPGNAEFQQQVGFSCRDTRLDYKLDDTFILYEARWQQMLRLGGSVGEPWEEPIVTAPNNDPTMPHPGREGWQNLSAYGKVTLQNIDISTGKAKARASQQDKGLPADKGSLESSYVINVQKSS